MEIKEIDIDDALYEKTLDLRTQVISLPFGFTPPTKSNETPDSHMFIAMHNNQVIGFVMITPSEDKKSIRARQVAVKPDQQRQGIGKLLMQQAETAAKHLGYHELYLFAHKDSYPFFTKLNYAPQGDWQTQDNGLATILMNKQL